MDIDMGEKIRELRTSLDLSQKNLANLIGVHPSAVSFYENGTRNIPDRDLKKIARVLGVDQKVIKEHKAPVPKQITLYFKIMKFYDCTDKDIQLRIDTFHSKIQLAGGELLDVSQASREHSAETYILKYVSKERVEEWETAE